MASKKQKRKNRLFVTTSEKVKVIKKQKALQKQKDDVGAFLSNIAANTTGAGLLSIAMSKGEITPALIGVGLIALGAILQLISLRVKK